MPGAVPLTPRYSSSAPNSSTNSHAGIGIGGINNMIRRFGNIIAKPSSKPNKPPEAPTVACV